MEKYSEQQKFLEILLGFMKEIKNMIFFFEMQQDMVSEHDLL
jgi:hypothetical protein